MMPYTTTNRYGHMCENTDQMNRLSIFPKVTACGAAAMLGAVLMLGGCATTRAAYPEAAQATPVSSAKAAIPHDLTSGQTQLAARLFPALLEASNADDNLFISPLSLSQGLGLAVIGARGRTRTELNNLLGWSDDLDVAGQIAPYNQFLAAAGDGVELRVANALWTGNLPLRPAYVTQARTWLGAEAAQLDFQRAPQAAAGRINGWVADVTRNRIPSIVTADALTSDTGVVLTNALFFKGRWTTPFERAGQRSFRTGSGAALMIDMIEQTGSLQYRETADGQAVALPYGQDGRFVIEVFLPRDAVAMSRWLSRITPLSFSAGEQGSNDLFDLAAAQTARVKLTVPRFEVRFTQGIGTALSSAGVTCAFDAACADFGNMADARLRIGAVLHATMLRIDELGTEAAAATAVTIRVISAPAPDPNLKVMIVDRPFLVTLRDRASGALLFFGRIVSRVRCRRPFHDGGPQASCPSARYDASALTT